MPTYNRADLAFERGEGAWLWTTDGRRFLDFGSGIATSSLGHGHPHLVQAIAEQAAKVMHVSNLYRVPQAERWPRATSRPPSRTACSSATRAPRPTRAWSRRCASTTPRPATPSASA
jgi:acetylornithine/succinyldiaminopimelate/putrescine aminotransferase